VGVISLTTWFGLAALLYGAIYYVVSRQIFRPMRYPAGPWHTQAELGAEDVWIETADGVRLHAWLVKAEAPANGLITLYFKGNGTNLSNRPGHLREIAAAGCPVLIVDYRGYGKSQGRPTERGIYRDADAAYDHLIGIGYAPAQIVLLGESLGAAVAVDLARRRPCAGVILECAFTSFSAMAGTFVPWVGPLVASGFNSLAKIRDVHVPLLVIHGDHDTFAPYAMGRALFDAANQPKSFWTVEGAGHIDILQVAGPLYRARLQVFYAGLI